MLPVLLSLGGLFVSSAAAEATPVVEVANGFVQGALSEYVEGVNTFRGIRYADSTAGENRWIHPPKPSNWTGIQNATVFAPNCPKPDDPGDEDCLFLNIWTPENFTTESNYPVYFWIYGGRFEGGAGSDLTYEASGLAAKGVVVVNFNYRLGALGYLAHPELSAENNGSVPSGNYGLHDQLAALHWTNENIQAFGGNASQITIGGQSAGSASVLDLVYSPLAAGLFQGAIAESGARAPHDPITGSLATSHRNMTTALSEGEEFLAELNVSTIAEARNLSLDAILALQDEVALDTTFVGTPFENNQAYGEPPRFRPVIDSYYFGGNNYIQILTQGLQNDVPIITGNNRDESGAVPGLSLNLTVYNSSNNLIFEPLGLADTFFELFPASNDDESSNQTNSFYRNQSLVSTYNWANLWATTAKSNVYTYYWTHAPPGQSGGAFHGSEILYAFKSLGWGTTLMGSALLNYTATDYAIEDTLSDYWYNFIATGNPNAGNLTQWEPSTETGKTVMQLGDAWGTMSVASDAVISFITEFFSYETAY